MNALNADNYNSFKAQNKNHTQLTVIDFVAATDENWALEIFFFSVYRSKTARTWKFKV